MGVKLDKLGQIVCAKYTTGTPRPTAKYTTGTTTSIGSSTEALEDNTSRLGEANCIPY
jgi:hypothetical protein